MATPLGKPRDKADRPDKPRPIRVAAKCGVCIVALLGFVVLATTFVARLASVRILPATQSAEDLIRGSLMLQLLGKLANSALWLGGQTKNSPGMSQELLEPCVMLLLAEWMLVR